MQTVQPAAVTGTATTMLRAVLGTMQGISKAADRKLVLVRALRTAATAAVALAS